jgi:DNA-directed RNA polymerase specialized sigma24 family protein
MDPGAVAEALNLSTNQVYVAKHRVLERIREMMRELHGEDGVV